VVFTLDPPLLDGGVKGRNPALEFVLFAGEDGPRACFGDIAGA
jgi:hypothetical protein